MDQRWLIIVDGLVYVVEMQMLLEERRVGTTRATFSLVMERVTLILIPPSWHRRIKLNTGRLTHFCLADRERYGVFRFALLFIQSIRNPACQVRIEETVVSIATFTLFLMAYSQRLNYFKKTRCWELGEGCILWSEEGAEGRILFSEIRNVRMAFAPSRTEAQRFSIKLDTSRGQYEITNIDWHGPLSSENKMDEFRTFVEQLHSALASGGCETAFHLGVSKGAYIGYWVLSLFVLGFLFAAGIFFFNVGSIWIVGIKVLLILFYLLTLFRFLKKNYPRSYEPDTVPWDKLDS